MSENNELHNNELHHAHKQEGERCPLPEPAVVPCVWDNAAAAYVPVYSYRGGEITAALATLRAENERLKSHVVTFVALWAVQYAEDHQLNGLHPTHYDLLAECGARLTDFKRATPAQEPESDDVCPYCGRDPYHYEDVGTAFPAKVAVNCCDRMSEERAATPAQEP